MLRPWVMRNNGVITDCIMDPARIADIPDLMARNRNVWTQTFDQAVFISSRTASSAR